MVQNFLLEFYWNFFFDKSVPHIWVCPCLLLYKFGYIVINYFGTMDRGVFEVEY